MQGGEKKMDIDPGSRRYVSFVNLILHHTARGVLFFI